MLDEQLAWTHRKASERRSFFIASAFIWFTKILLLKHVKIELQPSDDILEESW